MLAVQGFNEFSGDQRGLEWWRNLICFATSVGDCMRKHLYVLIPMLIPVCTELLCCDRVSGNA